MNRIYHSTDSTADQQPNTTPVITVVPGARLNSAILILIDWLMEGQRSDGAQADGSEPPHDAREGGAV